MKTQARTFCLTNILFDPVQSDHTLVAAETALYAAPKSPARANQWEKMIRSAEIRLDEWMALQVLSQLDSAEPRVVRNEGRS